MGHFNCALCDVLITEINDSKEHIIPNALGGRRTVSGFICEDCNSKSGKEWDADLARQLSFFSLYLNIRRARGEVPSQVLATIGGDRFEVFPDGHLSPATPEYKETVIEGGTSVQIKARSVKEAEKMLAGVKRKFPQVDVDQVLQRARHDSVYISDMLGVNFKVGGHKAGRSLVKSALALAVSCGVQAQRCECARQYLTTESGLACFGYYYEPDLVQNRPSGKVFHCVAVRGDAQTKQLLGYIELYSVVRAVMCLSETYTGKNFASCYCIDPVAGQELELEVNLAISKEEIQAAYNLERYSPADMVKALDGVLPIALGASWEKERERVVFQAVHDALKQIALKEGETITAEHGERLSQLIAEKVLPFILHAMRRNQ